MKNILVVLFVFLISCSTDSENVTDCKCKKTVYKYELISMSGASPNWGYVEQYTIQDYSFECEDATNNYISEGNNTYYTVDCE